MFVVEIRSHRLARFQIGLEGEDLGKLCNRRLKEYYVTRVRVRYAVHFAVQCSPSSIEKRRRASVPELTPVHTTYIHTYHTPHLRA